MNELYLRAIMWERDAGLEENAILFIDSLDGKFLHIETDTSVAHVPVDQEERLLNWLLDRREDRCHSQK